MVNTVRFMLNIRCQSSCCVMSVPIWVLEALYRYSTYSVLVIAACAYLLRETSSPLELGIKAVREENTQSHRYNGAYSGYALNAHHIGRYATQDRIMGYHARSTEPDSQ